MSKMKIKKGDKVIVIAGDDKGKTGEVLKAMPKLGKVIVQGVFQEHHSGCCNLVSAGSVLHLAFQDVIKDIFLSIDGLHKFLTVVSVENILCRLNLTFVQVYKLCHTQSDAGISQPIKNR